MRSLLAWRTNSSLGSAVFVPDLCPGAPRRPVHRRLLCSLDPTTLLSIPISFFKKLLNLILQTVLSCLLIWFLEEIRNSRYGGLPWWCTGSHFELLCRGLNPWSGNQIPHAKWLTLSSPTAKKKAAAGMGMTLTRSSLPAPRFPTVPFPVITWWFLIHSEL